MEKTLSKYSRRFDKNSPQWEDEMSVNRITLKYYQNYFNEVLKVRGYVFLRDIYEIFEFKVDQAAVVCGWIYDKDNPVGDNFIDFGIAEGEGEDYFDLDFNVDGSILERF